MLKTLSLFLQQSLQRSHHESSLASVKEDEDDIVDSPPNLPHDESMTTTSGERCSTPSATLTTVSQPSSEPHSEPVTPDKRVGTPPTATDRTTTPTPVSLKDEQNNSENRQTDEETVPTSSPISQSRYLYYFLIRWIASF